jgi:hypothetical protein
VQSWDLSARSRLEATPHMCCSAVVTHMCCSAVVTHSHSVEVHVSCVNHSDACMYSAASAATATDIATHSLMVWCHVCLLVAQCLCCVWFKWRYSSLYCFS